MFFSLECHGILSKTVVESVKKANIITWSNTLTIMPERCTTLHEKQCNSSCQLLQIWQDGRKHLTRPVNCATVVNLRQIKHVLTNCISLAALERYKRRHNGILETLADWLASVIIIIQSKPLCGHHFREVSSCWSCIQGYCTPGHCDPT